MGRWTGDRWDWEWCWRRSFFVWEADIFRCFQDCLMQVSPSKNVEDSWCWKPDSNNGFSVKSAYGILFGLRCNVPSDPLFCSACNLIWQCDIPSKVSILAWRLLQNKLPTKESLANKGVLGANGSVTCIFCSRDTENHSHLFFTCEFAYRVWMAVNLWSGTMGPMFNHGINHFLEFAGTIKGRARRRSRHIIWMATVWVLWITRNNVIFRSASADVIDVVANIKALSWNWFVNRGGKNRGLLYSDWCSNPLGCI